MIGAAKGWYAMPLTILAVQVFHNQIVNFSIRKCFSGFVTSEIITLDYILFIPKSICLFFK